MKSWMMFAVAVAAAGHLAAPGRADGQGWKKIKEQTEKKIAARKAQADSTTVARVGQTVDSTLAKTGRGVDTVVSKTAGFADAAVDKTGHVVSSAASAFRGKGDADEKLAADL